MERDEEKEGEGEEFEFGILVQHGVLPNQGSYNFSVK